MNWNRSTRDPGDAPPAGSVESWLSAWPRPPAREAFRRELGRAFVEGFPDERARERRARLRRAIWTGAGLAAAAGIAWFVVTERVPRGTNPSPLAWTYRTPNSPLHRLPGDGGELEVEPPDPVDLVFGDRFRLRAMPGARVAGLSSAAVSGAPAPLDLARGEILVTTRSPGPPLEVRTPQAEVRIVGSSASVLAEELGTCVCVAAGEVYAKGREATCEDAVEPEHTWFRFAHLHERFGARFYGSFHCSPTFFAPGEEDAHLAPLIEFERER